MKKHASSAKKEQDAADNTRTKGEDKSKQTEEANKVFAKEQRKPIIKA